MDNIIQIERLRHVKIFGGRSLFYDLINSCPGKSENLKPQGSLRVLLLLCFLLRSSPPKLILEVSISQNSIGGFMFWLQDIDLHIY